MEAPVALHAESRRFDIRRNEMIEGCPTRLGALVECYTLLRSAAADSLGFAHSAAAAGIWRRRSVRSVDLKQIVCSDGRNQVVRSIELPKTICVHQTGLAKKAGKRK